MKISDVINDSKLNESLKPKKGELSSSGIAKENVLEEFEIKSKIRKVCLGIPTKDLDVKNILRLLKEPICLFGEDSYDKRKRLKNVLVTKYDKLIIKKNNENEEEVEEFKNILKKYYIDFSKLYDPNSPEYLKINELEEELGSKRLKQQIASAKNIISGNKIKEKFYTESTEELKLARVNITLKTLPRIFLYKEMMNKFQDKYSKDDFENYINSYNEHMKNEFDLYISQLGDDRPLTMGKFSPDNRFFAVSSYNTYINIFNYKNDNYDVVRTLKKGHDDKINCIEWNYPNNYSYYSTMNYMDICKNDLLLASCSSDKTFCIWRPFAGEDTNMNVEEYENSRMGKEEGKNGFSQNEDGLGDSDEMEKKRGNGCERNVDKIKENSENGDEKEKKRKDKDGNSNNYLLCKIKAHEDRINKICFHPLNKYVLTCSEDETIKFFDIETEEELFYQEGHNAIVYSATFNPYGNLYLSGDSKGGLMLWDIRTGKNIEKKNMIHNNCITNINFNPFRPNMFCTCSSDNTIKIFDLRNFKMSCNILAHNKIVTDAIFEPTYGRYITSCSFDTFIKIWDSVNFYCTKILYNNDNKVRNVDISPDGRFISSTSFDRTWKLYKNEQCGEANILSHFF
ncbi:U4/U6 small nuclear ribonucleoprotein PRP4, putative [Plasmodium ovale wallikeri]|uniref:U4/U6 small nuclear ribonucleoprotein PRP4, putative n=2 Tax=Plasmodium ovale TaxID=36330 RepID=A0A1A8Z9Y6_PLAOA|nr:U4/U6 small nuclear ribonucleoprotein PRP4, putative [Plasmodium ovale wallikeri]SBT40645.1 U4/U6 small nuclear ribonucleoprotein PRP4, putative [Plasmodium ovale wallikeri]SBT77998.1 U4/U6 small nuclear ribonucleoprotein PRP4, putative [Plasmodium ovale]